MSVAATYPPGPRTPRTLQTVAALTRQRPHLERLRRRYGNLFSVEIHAIGTMVIVADPALVKQVFTASPTVLHAGTGSPLGTVLGRHSLLATDEEYHLEQRKLLLPPFHGKRMQAYEQLIADFAADEIDRWPEGTEFATIGSFMTITLRAILGAVFGAAGEDLDVLERVIPPYVESGSRMATLRGLQKDLGPRSPWGRFLAHRAAVDARLDILIERARGDAALAERSDVLALLVQATHTDGSPMTSAEIRDQLVTLLAAGHETTAGTLAWAVERLRRHPDLAARLTAEVDAGGRALRDATIRELQRSRPVISFAGRLTREEYELGGYRLPSGTRIGLAAGLTHYDPDLFPEPDRFLPERFLTAKPDTYSWIPFGGGIRRCIGAAFAHMEMDVVLRTLLERVELVGDASAPDERWAFRGVAHVPAEGGRVTIRRRPASAANGADPATAAALALAG
ncbi:Putative cytochrome P450 138 [Paraconexibacter sp. AEG42_29]|uniref:Cytochrome P450 138 n=1 Tax=Paraconexibacter sp. AEG42_29 TaxID=2997339 RepID=A0AAU7AXH7_9ACTN